MEAASETVTTGNDEEYPESCSLSIESFSKDSLFNEHGMENSPGCSTGGCFVLKRPPKVSASVVQQPKEVDRSIYLRTQKSSNQQHQSSMIRSSGERPWSTPARSVFTVSFSAKQCEEKLQMAKEEEQRKQRQRISLLDKSERNSQKARLRKEMESQRRIAESKLRSIEKERFCLERKERLKLAEEERRRTIEMRIGNTGDMKSSPRLINATSSHCESDSSKTTPRKMVGSRSTRPLSSTGKVIGFGSSTPRPICDNVAKLKPCRTKIPDALLAKCEILSRPSSSMISERMTDSVICYRVFHTSPNHLPERITHDRKMNTRTLTASSLTKSSIDYTTRGKSDNQMTRNPLPRRNMTIKEDVRAAKTDAKRIGALDTKRPPIVERKPTAVLSTMTKSISEMMGRTKSSRLSKFPKDSIKCKVDIHLDSDSVEEEVSVIQDTISRARRLISQKNSGSPRLDIPVIQKCGVSVGDESRSMPGTNRTRATKDVSEEEYKTRLMENRRLVREKRENEREKLMKSERERRHIEEINVREAREITEEQGDVTDETYLTMTNDDTLEGLTKVPEENGELTTTGEELSEIVEEFPIMSAESSQLQADKFERKKILDSIMNRIRVQNDQPCCEEGVKSEGDNHVSSPVFRSSFLQSMMTNRRISSTTNQTNGTAVGTAEGSDSLRIQEEANVSSGSEAGDIEDDLVPPNGDREDCDGKEDSLSFKEDRVQEKCNAIIEVRSLNKAHRCSSTDTDEEIIKISFEISTNQVPPDTNFMTQGNTCVLQN